MKSYSFLLYCIGILSCFACTLNDFSPEEWAVDPELTLSNNYIAFNSAISTQSIGVNTNYQDFTVSASEEWCHVEVNKDSMSVEITVDPNSSAEQRMARVDVTVARGVKSLTKELTVIQFGGVWDVIGDFQVYWRSEVGTGQRDAIVELLENLSYVEGNTFVMGRDNDAHQVSLSSFYIGKYEITQNQWNAIMFENPSQYRGRNLPVENITWFEAFEFVDKLSNLTGLKIALPTEAQWEFAARGGIHSLGYKYPGSNDYTEVAHFVDGLVDTDSPLYTTVVGGSKLHNELGIYDMAGNVKEFCFDWYDANYENVPTNVDPTGVKTGIFKVVRGGDFRSPFTLYDVCLRWPYARMNSREELTGLRIVVNI